MGRCGVPDDRFTCMCVMEALAAEGLVSATVLTPARSTCCEWGTVAAQQEVNERQALKVFVRGLQVHEAAGIWKSMVWGPNRRRPDRKVCIKLTYKHAGTPKTKPLKLANDARSQLMSQPWLQRGW
jgi:hypothetical protein